MRRSRFLIALAFTSMSLFAQPRYAPKPANTCSARYAYGSIVTTAKDCRAMGGAMNGAPPDSQWTACYLDWCAETSGGSFTAARPGTCASKRGYGIIKTTGGDCRRLGGGMNGTPGDGDWTDCHLDWCSSGGSYTAAAPGSCGAAKVGYGIISTTGGDCRRMGGAMNGVPGDTQWTDCHLDWCQTTAASALTQAPDAIEWSGKYRLVSVANDGVNLSAPPSYGSQTVTNVAATHRGYGLTFTLESASSASSPFYGATAYLRSNEGAGYLDAGTAQPAVLANPVDADWGLSFDHAGWSNCPPNTIMTGTYRNPNVAGEGIYMLEMARCVQPWGVEVESTSTADWWKCFDNPAGAQCVCPTDTFLAGLNRTEGNDLFNIEEGRCLKLKNTRYGSCTWEGMQSGFGGILGWKVCGPGRAVAGYQANVTAAKSGLDRLTAVLCCEPAFNPGVTMARRQSFGGTAWTLEYPGGGNAGKPIPLGGQVVLRAPDGRALGASPSVPGLYLFNPAGAWETWKIERIW